MALRLTREDKNKWLQTEGGQRYKKTFLDKAKKWDDHAALTTAESQAHMDRNNIPSSSGSARSTPALSRLSAVRNADVDKERSATTVTPQAVKSAATRNDSGVRKAYEARSNTVTPSTQVQRDTSTAEDYDAWLTSRMNRDSMRDTGIRSSFERRTEQRDAGVRRAYDSRTDTRDADVRKTYASRTQPKTAAEQARESVSSVGNLLNTINLTGAEDDLLSATGYDAYLRATRDRNARLAPEMAKSAARYADAASALGVRGTAMLGQEGAKRVEDAYNEKAYAGTEAAKNEAERLKTLYDKISSTPYKGYATSETPTDMQSAAAQNETRDGQLEAVRRRYMELTGEDIGADAMDKAIDIARSFGLGVASTAGQLESGAQLGQSLADAGLQQKGVDVPVEIQRAMDPTHGLAQNTIQNAYANTSNKYASDPVMKYLLSGAQAAGNMAMQQAIGLASGSGNLGLTAMLAQGFGDTVNESLDKGLSPSAALGYGLASTVVSGLTERMAGGVPGLPQGELTKRLKSDALRNSTLGKIADIAIDKLGEGFEEVVEALAEPLVGSAFGVEYTPDNPAYDAGKILDAGITGVIASIFAGSVSDIQTIVQSVGAGDANLPAVLHGAQLCADAINEYDNNLKAALSGALDPAVMLKGRAASDMAAGTAQLDYLTGNAMEDGALSPNFANLGKTIVRDEEAKRGLVAEAMESGSDTATALAQKLDSRTIDGELDYDTATLAGRVYVELVKNAQGRVDNADLYDAQVQSLTQDGAQAAAQDAAPAPAGTSPWRSAPASWQYGAVKYDAAQAPANLGASGVKAFSDMNTGDISPDDFTEQFNRYYRAGKIGVSLDSVPRSPTRAAFSDAQVQEAYNAGTNDAYKPETLEAQSPTTPEADDFSDVNTAEVRATLAADPTGSNNPVVQDALRQTGATPEPEPTPEPAKPRGYVDSFQPYNERRYSRPWVGAVKPDGKMDFNIGTYSGAKPGDGGDIFVRNPIEGYVYAYGQKDGKTGRSDTVYLVFENGAFRKIDRQTALKLAKTPRAPSAAQAAGNKPTEIEPEVLQPPNKSDIINEEAASEPAPKPAPAPVSAPATKPAPAPEPAPVTADTDYGKAAHTVAQKVQQYIEQGVKFSPAKLYELCDKAFGGTQAAGTYLAKDAYDAMELGVNMYLLSSDAVKNGNSDKPGNIRFALDTLLRVQGDLVTQTKRTEEQTEFQQFSTPPAIAYIASWAANITSSDTVLEPSAGIGGIASFPKAWGAKVIVNELSDRRLSVIKNLPFDGFFNENAEHINDILPESVKPTVVVMNPPFSATAGRVSSHDTKNATLHIDSALARLPVGGRLVTVLGKGMAADAKAFQSYWRGIAAENNLLANIGIDGKLYTKYGTNWGVQIVVIDKGGETSETVTGQFSSLYDAAEALMEVRNARPQINAGIDTRNAGIDTRAEQSASGTGVQEAVVQPVPEAGKAVSGDTGEGSPDGVGVRGGRTGISGRPAGHGLSGRPGTGGNNDQQAGEDGTRPGELRGLRESGGDTGSGGRGLPVDHGEPGNIGRDEAAGTGSEVRGADVDAGLVRTNKASAKAPSSQSVAELERNIENVYTSYTPKKVSFEGARKHPARLVESAAMSSVAPPDVTYTPNLPNALITAGTLSDAQLEAITYAGQAHSKLLPDGRRRGFFIGDGTGVGKGREICGVIMDNFRSGRTKAVWVSKGTNLYEDAVRDWVDLGGKKEDVIDASKLKAGKSIAEKSGILFISYDTLKSASRDKPVKRRMDDVSAWLGDDFDGAMVFDESHKMGSAITSGTGRAKKEASQTALAGVELQDRIPGARVLYASATGATEVSNLSYLTRLGLWGQGTAFSSVNEFVNKIQAGGVGAMEVVSRDMKADGSYLARSISYDGVQYETLQHNLTPEQREIYNTMSRAWQVILKNTNKALEIIGAGKGSKARSNAMSAFFSYQQRFYSQILTSMSMPSVIADAKKQLADGKSVVFQLVNTNESAQNKALEKSQKDDEDLEELDLTPRETLVQMLENSFPVELQEEYEDENGNRKTRAVKDSNGKPVLSKEAVRMRDELIATVQGMAVPDGPIESLLHEFGPDAVAEVTGRTKRVVYRPDASGRNTLIVEKWSKAKSVADANAFQDGKKRILIFSDAGGTGKSYHADKRAKNQQQRVHYLVQAGWVASNAIQGFGRTHRSNEVSAPIYKLCTTDISGQKRFLSTIARRLEQLGALTKGSRGASGGGMFSERDNLESTIAENALATFYQSVNPESLRKIGLYDKVFDEYGGLKTKDASLRNVRMFLNRILSLEMDEQNGLFDRFFQQIQTDTDTAIEKGTLDRGTENKLAEKVTIASNQVIREGSAGEQTRHMELTLYEKPKLASLDFCMNSGTFQGLFRINDTGEVVAVSQISDQTDSRGTVHKRYRLQTVVRSQFSTMQDTNLKAKTTPIPKKEWASAWNEQAAKAPELTESTVHIITGSLLPIWDKLPQSNTRVMRVVSKETGESIIGRILTEDQTDTLMNTFHKQREMRKYTPQEVMEHITERGETASLTNNGWKITRRRVAGEYRIEVYGYNTFTLRDIPGIIREIIQSKSRTFIPTGDAGVKVLEEILNRNPLTSLKKAPTGNYENLKQNRKPSPDNWNAAHAVRPGDPPPKSLSALIDDIRRKYDIPVNVGKIRGAGIQGQYDRKHEAIRTRIANDLPTLLHEVGHHLDKLHSIREQTTAEADAELISNLPDEMRQAYKPSELLNEGIAEFFRAYFTDRTAASKAYPVFSTHLDSLLTDEERVGLEKLGNDINFYMATPRTPNSINVRAIDEKRRDNRPARDQFNDMADRYVYNVTDSTQGIKRASAYTGDRTPWILALNSHYADNRAAQAIAGTLHDINGNSLNVSLRDALKGVRVRNAKEWADFGRFLIVRHAPERMAEGQRIFADDTMNTTEWCEEQYNDLSQQYPDFENAASRLEKFQSAFLQGWAVESRIISQATADEWAKRWQHYVPFKRWFDKADFSSNARITFANQKDPYKKARGSGRDIIHPVDSIISDMVTVINTAVRNDVMFKLADQLNETEGSARFMERIPNPLNAVKVKLDDVKKTLADRISKSDMEQDDIYRSLGIIDGLPDVLQQYRTSNKKGGYGSTVTIIRNGKAEYYQINDPLLLDSVASLDESQRNAVVDAYGKISRFMTGNLTGLNVVWSLFSNFPRDIQTFMTYSYNRNPIRLIGAIGEGYANALKQSAGKRQDPMYEEFMAMGGNSTSAYSSDPRSIASVRNELAPKFTKYLNPLNDLGLISDMIEKGPRFAAYKNARRAGRSPSESFRIAMDVTTDFRRHGIVSKQINKFVPFYNAGVQGVDRFVRFLSADDAPAGSRKGVSAGRVIAYIVNQAAIAALGAFLNFKDEDDRENYKQLSAYTKNAYMCIPLGAGKYIAISKNRELSVLSSFFESCMEHYLLENPYAFDGFAEYATSNFLPGGVAELVNAAIATASGDSAGASNNILSFVGALGMIGTFSYLAANKDFLGRPIVSDALYQLMPSQQYDQMTSKLAFALGNALELSPKQLDFLGNSILGGFWKYQKALFPVGIENRDVTLGVMNQYVKDSAYSTDTANRLYDKGDVAAAYAKSNPDDIDAKLKAKWYDRMTTYYSRYAQLTKGAAETKERRDTRQTVMRSVYEFTVAMDEDHKTNEQIALEKLCRSIGETTLLPAVMEKTVKNKKTKATYDLSDIQYTEYQHTYDTLYWAGVSRALAKSGLTEEGRVMAVQKAKNNAKEKADEWILGRVH